MGFYDILLAKQLAGSGGGGGGGGDFSTATVTVQGNDGSAIRGAFISTFPMQPPLEATSGDASFGNTLVLYKGKGLLYVQASVDSVSGDIQHLGDIVYLVTGNCTITIA